MERRAGFKNETAEILRELWSQKRTTLATIDAITNPPSSVSKKSTP